MTITKSLKKLISQKSFTKKLEKSSQTLAFNKQKVCQKMLFNTLTSEKSKYSLQSS